MIRLVSLNIEFSKHLDLVAAFLSSEKPDVACIQEVYEHDAPFIAQALGSTSYVFAPMHHFIVSGVNAGVLGLGIFSRHPILNKRTHYYRGNTGHIPAMDYADPATYQHTNLLVISAEFLYNDTSFNIATTHFTWTPDGKPTDLQRQDLTTLLRVLESLGEFVLVGDFNAPRGGEIFDAIAARYKDNIPPHYKTSIYGKLHRSRQDLQLMVDGLFTTPAYTASNVELKSGMSDHYAVVADIATASSE